jgi:hypothetical protein
MIYLSHLQHLNERHAEVHVCHVPEYQTETEHSSDWNDRSPGKH